MNKASLENLRDPRKYHWDCSSFVVVDPTTMEWEVVRVEPDGPTPPPRPPL